MSDTVIACVDLFLAIVFLRIRRNRMPAALRAVLLVLAILLSLPAINQGYLACKGFIASF